MLASKTKAIWWIRRDLRLFDNQALTTACQYAEEVLPVFILDPKLRGSPNVGPKRLAFLIEGLRQLDRSLQERGSRLIVCQGMPSAELPKLIDESGATAVFAEEDYSPYARQRDSAVGGLVCLRLLPGLTVQHPTQVVKANGEAYTVFTPFSKAWKSRYRLESLLPIPTFISKTNLPGEPLPDISSSIPTKFISGEAEAQRSLSAFVEGELPKLHQYAEYRDRPDLNATSGLSAYIRFGMLSARQVIGVAWDAIRNAPTSTAQKGAETWLNELIWREFFQAILYHFPQVREGSFRKEFRNIPWTNDADDFRAWCEGQTGYPIVDAAMRQLAETGWMHNRSRMIVASFLTKDLLIDWRWGERWFMQNLVDGELAANNGGWQWVAGTGTDAAPYFRVFNPVLQGKRFDPNGDYVRRWIPELSAVPTALIHTPWEMSLDEQNRAGCRVGKDYPAPIVDHAWARERALEVYSARE